MDLYGELDMVATAQEKEKIKRGVAIFQDSAEPYPTAGDEVPPAASSDRRSDSRRRNPGMTVQHSGPVLG